MPIVIVDDQGAMIYWNEPAELLLGIRFEEIGEVPTGIWREQFAVRDDEKNLIPEEQWPLIIALTEHSPVSRVIWIGVPDGSWRRVTWTSVPFLGHDGEFLGVQSVFWEA